MDRLDRHANQHGRQRNVFVHQRPLSRESLPLYLCKYMLTTLTQVIENWRDGIPQGWLARDHPAWFSSTQRLKRLEATTKGRVIPGHDKETFLALQSEGSTFT